MGQTPAKQFAMPTPFGGTPQGNNVSQVQPLAQNQGPGFAPASASDQMQMNMQPPITSPMMGGGNMFQNRKQIESGLNPFRGMLQQ